MGVLMKPTFRSPRYKAPARQKSSASPQHDCSTKRHMISVNQQRGDGTLPTANQHHASKMIQYALRFVALSALNCARGGGDKRADLAPR
jgi:hypothetical protein